MKYDNEEGVSGVIAGLMIFIILVVASLGFLFVNNAFNEQYNAVIKDPVNSTGIYANNTTPYESVKVISTGLSDNIPTSIMVAFLLAVIAIIVLIWAILKKGD